MTVLEDAYMELRRRRSALDAIDTPGALRERRVISALEDVADYTKRIGDNGDSAHYRCDKSHPMVDAAIGVAIASFENYYGDDDDEALGVIERDLLDAVSDAFTRLWDLRS